MSKTEELIELSEQYGAHNYLPLPVVLTEGEGSIVKDVEGKEYLDFLSCYSALNFGHGHPELLEVLSKQAKKLALTSRAFHNEELCHFVKELANFCGMETVLPMNSGSEAVETALKLARKWAYKKKGLKPEQSKIIAMRNNFHGRTISIISFSTEDLYRSGFGPFTPGFQVVEFGDVSAIESVIDENTIGVLMEPIQAEAGILIPQDGYLEKTKQLCEKYEALLILDEIQTGLGRTGRDFCFQYEAMVPDMLILGKSLGGGLIPLSAMVTRKEIMEVVRPGEHGSTFGGNPLACALGRKVIQLLQQALSERSERLGENAMELLCQKALPAVKEIRGKGLLIGIELEESAGGARKYCEALAHEGVLCKETHDHVIRIAPPLTIPEATLQRGLEKIVQVIESIN